MRGVWPRPAASRYAHHDGRHHAAAFLRDMREIILLLDVQRIHIGAQCDCAVALQRSFEGADHTRAGDAALNGYPEGLQEWCDQLRRLVWVEPCRSISVLRMAAYGASFSLPHLPAKVSSLNAERPLSLGGANWPSCPHCGPPRVNHCGVAGYANMRHPARRSG